MYFILFLFALPAILVVYELFPYLIHGKRWYPLWLIRLLDALVMLALPIFYLGFIDKASNDCCNDSATFSPDHQLTIHFLVALCIFSYFYASWNARFKSPVSEVFINIFLLIGLIFNLVMCYHVQIYALFGNLPIIILILYKLHENHLHFIENIKIGDNKLEKIAYYILTLPSFYKFPILILLSLPILTIIMCVLLLLGQKPDSIVRAFTDTYKHGFSQLDYMCDNVHCGGHFLCSVAAKGNPTLVKPIRLGERGGNKILCNRQLLISNAFEEWLQDYFPIFHRIVRTQYNKIGNKIHKHYHFFNKKWVSNTVYLLMKPLEILFLVFLYTFDSKPENRINQQYLTPLEREKIKSQTKNV